MTNKAQNTVPKTEKTLERRWQGSIMPLGEVLEKEEDLLLLGHPHQKMNGLWKND